MLHQSTWRRRICEATSFFEKEMCACVSNEKLKQDLCKYNQVELPILKGKPRKSYLHKQWCCVCVCVCVSKTSLIGFMLNMKLDSV